MSEATPIQQIRDSLIKQAAAQDDVVERVAAFDFGIDVYCQTKGLDKAAMAGKVGLQADQLAEGLIACLNQGVEEVPQASKNV